MRLEEPVRGGQLIVNCRAEADPEILEEALNSGIEALRTRFPEITFRLDHIEKFRPGRPQPTHRFGALAHVS